jgi:saccharopine dehydrogenase-like NADP-dependent oxidoreductase
MTVIGLIGLGRVGFRALKILINRKEFFIKIFEKDPFKKSLVSEYENIEFVETRSFEDIERHMNDIDLFMTALPSREAFKIIMRLAEKCVDIVDVSYIYEDPYVLEKIFMKCGRTYIPDAGFAPGYSNLLAGYAQDLFKDIERLEIYVGGIPRENIPPIGYVVTWSAEDLLEEYLRPARVVFDQKIVYKDPLEHIGEIEIPGIGVFQWFYSDGLRTLLKNIKARNMFEATLRWRGHLEKMRILKDLGLLSREKIVIDNNQIDMIRILASVFEKNLKIKTDDMAILFIRAVSRDERVYEETVVMYGDHEDPATTRFTAIVFASSLELLIDKKSEIDPGIMPLEKLYKYKDYYEERLYRYQPKKDLVKINRRIL